MVVGKASVYYENDGVYLANFKVFEKYAEEEDMPML